LRATRWSIPLVISINGQEPFTIHTPPLRLALEAVPGPRHGDVAMNVQISGEVRARAWMARLAGVLALGERVLGWRVEVTAG